jgi:thiol-disulfide isomerase/thioredoxin
MRSLRWSLLPVVTLGLALPLQAGELGMKAPKLEIAQWVKGEAVDVTDGKSVYVVEFWATWCGPCIQSIPHLTEMQKKYQDKVVFVGVSTDDARTVANVEPFVKKQGDKMEYVVAIDKDEATGKGYMGEFGIGGIPHAFVVDKAGNIVWHDHPMADLDAVIDLVLAGKFDKEAAAKIVEQRENEQRELMKSVKMMEEYFQLVTSTGKDSEAAKIGKQIVSQGGDNAQLMNALSWRILTDEGIQSRDLPLALQAAENANKATAGEDPAILDTYALALYENGKKTEAVEIQRKAVQLAEKAGAEQMAEELKGRLDRFEKGE